MEDFLRDQFHVMKTRVRKLKEQANAQKVLSPEEKEAQDRKIAEFEALQQLRQEIRNMAKEDTLSLAVEIPCRTKLALRASSNNRKRAAANKLLQGKSDSNLLVDGMSFRFGLIKGFRRYRHSAEFQCAFDSREANGKKEGGKTSVELSSVVQALSICEDPSYLEDGEADSEDKLPAPLLILSGHDDCKLRLWRATVSVDPDVGYQYVVKKLNEYAGNTNKVLDCKLGSLNWIRYNKRVEQFQDVVDQDKARARENVLKRISDESKTSLLDRNNESTGSKSSQSLVKSSKNGDIARLKSDKDRAISIQQSIVSSKTKNETKVCGADSGVKEVTNSEEGINGNEQHQAEVIADEKQHQTETVDDNKQHQTNNNNLGVNENGHESQPDNVKIKENGNKTPMLNESDTEVLKSNSSNELREHQDEKCKNFAEQQTNDIDLKPLLTQKAETICSAWNKELENDPSVSFEFVSCGSDGALRIWKLEHQGTDNEPEWVIAEKEQQDSELEAKKAEEDKLAEEQMSAEELAKKNNPINKLVAKVRQDRILAEQLKAAREKAELDDGKPPDTYPECALKTTNQVIDAHDNIIYAVAVSPDQQYIYSTSAGGNVRKWNSISHQEVYVYKAHNGAATTCAVSNDGRFLVTGGDHQDSSVCLWDATMDWDSEANAFSSSASGEDVDTLENLNMIESLFLGNVETKEQIINDRSFKSFRNGTNKGLSTIHERRRRNAKIHLLGQQPGGRGVLGASLSDDRYHKAQLKKAQRNGGKIQTFTGSKSSFHDRPHIDWINQVQFSPSGSQVASVSSDHTVKLWNTSKGVLQTTFIGHTDWVLGCGFSPNGFLLASCSADTTIILWNLQNESRMRTLYGHYDAVCRCTFTPSSTQLVSSSYDGTIRIWGLTVSKPGRPAAPRIVHTTEYDMLLEWKAPVANGADITQYRICGRPLGRDRNNGDKPFEFKELALLDIQPHEFTKARVSQLHPGWMYEMTVAAKNDKGWGPTSAPSKARRCLPDVPSQPGQPVTVETTTTSATLLWIGPDSMGSHITHFLIQLRGGAYQSFENCEPTLVEFNTAKIAGERVKSLHEAIVNEYSEKAESIAGYSRSPEGKELKAKTAHGERLRLQVQAMKKQMGGGLEMYGSMNGLVPGIMYQFRICAVNREGQGPYSLPSVSEITKSTVPEIVDQVESREATLYSLLLRWVPPFSNGSVIQHYEICIGKKALVDRYIKQKLELGELKTQIDSLHTKTILPLQLKIKSVANGLSRTGLLELKDKHAIADGPRTLIFACLMLLDNTVEDLESVTRLKKQFGRPTQFINRLIKFHSTLFTERGLFHDDLVQHPIQPLAREVLNSIVDDEELQPELLSFYSTDVAALAYWLQYQRTLHNLLDKWRPKLIQYRKLYVEYTQVTQLDLFASKITVQGSTTQHVFDNLEPNTSYRFMVRARNTNGCGPYSEPTPALRTLKDTPTAPRGVVAFKPTPVSMTVNWIPALPCGLPIETYQVTYRIDRIGKYRDPPITLSIDELDYVDVDNPGKGFSTVIDGLLPLCQFEFRVRASNSLGFGEWSKPSDPFFTSPAKVPNRPAKPIVDNLNPSSCWVHWEQPTDNGSKIESYVVQWDVNESGEFVHKVTTEAGANGTQSCLIKNLVDGTRYRFCVSAINEVGAGELGPPSEPVVMPTEMEYIMSSDVLKGTGTH